MGCDILREEANTKSSNDYRFSKEATADDESSIDEFVLDQLLTEEIEEFRRLLRLRKILELHKKNGHIISKWGELCPSFLFFFFTHFFL